MDLRLLATGSSFEGLKSQLEPAGKLLSRKLSVHLMHLNESVATWGLEGRRRCSLQSA